MANEYIDREALLNDISETVLFSVRGGAELPTPEMRGSNKVIDRIKSAPTADVVEVVRCKDCMYGEHCYPSKRIGEEAEPAYWCKFMDQIVSVDGYCVYGKKMDGKGEGE